MTRWRWVGTGLTIATLALNGVAYRHARAMTTWVDEGARTAAPEALTMLQKVQTLLLGVTVPRPRETTSPADFGLIASDHQVPGPLGLLATWVVPGGPEAVLLVHGYASDRSQLLPTARRLHDQGYTVVLPNLRGSGDSAGSGTTLGWHEAADVAAVARWMDDDRPILYGFSMGGAAVLGAVSRHHVDAEALVLEATFDDLITTTGHRFAHMGLPHRGLSDLLLFWGGMQLGLNPYGVSPRHDAPSVHVPTLVVAGSEDARVHPEDAQRLATALPMGELRLVETLPHTPLASALPEQWFARVGQWLTLTAPP